jgi:transcriptional regulator with XRE-family HTH domain
VSVEEEVRQAARLLESLIQAAGAPAAGAPAAGAPAAGAPAAGAPAAGAPEDELERRLDVSPGYLRRLLAGEIELKLRHILSILRALEIEPALYFESLYPAGPGGGTIRMDALEQRLEGLGLGEPSAARPQVGIQDLERRVQSAAQTIENRRGPRRQDG